MTRLAQGKIVDGAAALAPAALQAALADLPAWVLSEDGKAIRRDWRFKSFKAAAQLANLAAWQAEAANHHPDITFGWGAASGRMKMRRTKTDPALDPPYLATIYPIRRRGLPSPSRPRSPEDRRSLPLLRRTRAGRRAFTFDGLVRFRPHPTR